MFKSIKKQFEPDLEAVVKRELYEAKLRLLEAETAVEWAASQVEYNRSRIMRLERTLNDFKNPFNQKKEPTAHLS